MNKIIFDSQTMKIIMLFSNITQVDAKDCVLEPERIIFIVPEHQISKAVGKGGANVRRLEEALKRKLKIVEFNSDLKEFTRNLIYPAKAKDIVEHDGELTITSPDFETRGYLIGRSAHQLHSFESVIKRHFPISKLKVV